MLTKFLWSELKVNRKKLTKTYAQRSVLIAAFHQFFLCVQVVFFYSFIVFFSPFVTTMVSKFLITYAVFFYFTLVLQNEWSYTDNNVKALPV